MNFSQAIPAPKRPNLSKLGGAGGFKFSGCPTQTKANFSVAFGIHANGMVSMLTRKEKDANKNTIFLRDLTGSVVMNSAATPL